MFIKPCLVFFIIISLTISCDQTDENYILENAAMPVSTSISTQIAIPTQISTPMWPYGITHYDGDLLPRRTYSGGDECEYNEQLSLTSICLEILSYAGVSKKTSDTAVLAISAIASRYANTEKEVTVDWPAFGRTTGKQNYLGFVLWHDFYSDIEFITTDICVFMRVLPTIKDSCKDWANELLTSNSSTNGAMTGSAWKIHNGSLSVISNQIWDKKFESLDNVLEHPKLAYNDPRRIFGHEYFHTYQSIHYINMPQQPLVAMPSFGPMWLLEGTSEYASSRISALEFWMDWNGHIAYRMDSINELLETKPNYRDLSSIETMAQVNEIIDTDDVLLINAGRVLVYDLGFWAVAYAISISSHDSVMVKYWDELLEYGPEKSFERNVGLTLEEFYSKFSEFLDLDMDQQLTLVPLYID